MKSVAAVAKEPDPDAHYLLAQTHYALNDFEAGIESVETAIRIAGEREIPVREAWTRLRDYMRSRIDSA